MKRLVAVAALVFVAASAMSRSAHAEMREVASRVVDQWKQAGAKATALSSRFLFDDETIAIPIPEAAAAGPCVHVALVGPRGMSFHARISDAGFDPLAPDVGARAAAVAGVLALERCDSRKVRYILVTSDAGRGALEIVVASSKGSLPSLVAVIPERTGGTLPPVPEAGSLPPLVTVDKRADAAESRAKRDGASVKARTKTKANDDSSGATEIAVEAGCHRIEVFGRDVPNRRFRLDLDAELREVTDDQTVVLARDRTEAPDARLEACVGKSTTLDVAFVGAVPGSEVVMTLASWPIPERLPPIWGSAARARMARSMLTRHVAVPTTDPIYLAQGGPGTTPFPLDVEPGGCYVAVVGITHGRPRALSIRAVVGARESSDDRGAADEAALTAFCVRAHETARIEVHGRGAGLGYGLAVYRVKSAVWEASP